MTTTPGTCPTQCRRWLNGAEFSLEFDTSIVPEQAPGSSESGAGPGASNIARVSGTPSNPTQAPARPLRVLVYSDDVRTREQVVLALGRRPHPDLPEVTYVEVATEPVVVEQVSGGQIDLAVLDGEAVPAGGMGIAKQLKDEVYDCPPVLVLTGRPQDAWLATWSRAEAAVSHPIDPIVLAQTVVALLRDRAALVTR